MKITFVKSSILGLFALFFIGTAQAGETEKGGKVNNKENDATIKVLVVGLDNVNSNYFPESMITEETGIPEDSISNTYNHIITENIIQANKDKNYDFISSERFKNAYSLVGNLQVYGEEEESYIDISQINKQNYARLLNETDADYVLFLNQHYLKWQDKPLRTLFHFVSYSLFDKNQHEITKGNNYFTCMNLEKAEKLSKASRKSSLKITTAIIKSIDK